MEYTILRTATADANIRSIILYISTTFGKDVALKKLDYIEESISKLATNPDLGTIPVYPVLRRQGIKVLILKKDLVFYKVDEEKKQIIIYAVADQRQDYLDIIKGL